MCGRFYIDEKTEHEIMMVVRELDGRFRQKFRPGDIHPTEHAPVITGRDMELAAAWELWGYPGIQGKGVIFNARSESVLEKPMFRNGMEYGRIAVPAAGFYEWNKNKEKNTFTRADGHALFFAGISSRFEDGEHFAILTTDANASMAPVHDRMPLILEAEQLRDWILDRKKAEAILKQKPVLLRRESEYEQMSLF